MTTNFDALREFTRLTPCIMEQDRKTIQFLIADAESYHAAAIQAAQVEMRTRARTAAKNTPFRAHAADDYDFHSGCMQTQERIVEAINALPLTTHALDLDRLRTRRESISEAIAVIKSHDEEYLSRLQQRLAELHRQIEELKSSGGDV